MVAHPSDQRTNRRGEHPPLRTEILDAGHGIIPDAMNASHLSLLARNAWFALAADGPAGEIPSWETLSGWCGCDVKVRQAKRAVRELVAAGWLRWEHGYYGLRFPARGQR